MTTLVTGGTGFLGRHLIKKLIENGEDDIRVLTRNFDIELSNMGVEVVEGSLNSSEDIRRVSAGVERVYHLAGRVERDPKHAHKMYELHVDGTRRLLSTLRDNNLEKVVVASTSGTVGVGTKPDFIADDDSETVENLVHRWPYYLSKIYAERVCQRFIDDDQMPIVQMRPTLLLGPGDSRESSTGDVVLFMKGKIPTLMSGGISFVDVRDAADAFITAMDKAPAGRTYLLGSANLTIAEFFTKLETLTGLKAPWVPLPDDAALAGARLLNSAMRLFGKEAALAPTSVEMAKYYWYIDWSLAQGELGFTTRDPMKTLRDTVRWIERYHADFGDGKLRKLPAKGLVSKELTDHVEQVYEDGR